MMGGIYGHTPGTPSTPSAGGAWSLPSPDSSTRTPPSTASSDAFIMSSPVQSTNARGGWRRESGSRHAHMQQDSFNAFAYQQWANSNSSSSSSMAEEDWTYGVQVDGGVPLFDSTIPLIPQQQLRHTTAQNDTAAAAVYNGYTGVNTQPLASISIHSNTAYPQGQQAFDWTMPQAGSTVQCGAPAVPVLTRPPGSKRHHSHPYKSSSGHHHAAAAPQPQPQQYGWAQGMQSPTTDSGAQWPTSVSGDVPQTRAGETMQWATPDGKNPSYAMMFETMITSAPGETTNAGAPYSGPSSAMFPSSWASQGPSSSHQFAPPAGYATLAVQSSSLSNDQIFDNVVPSSSGAQFQHHRSRSGQQQPQQGWRQ